MSRKKDKLSEEEFYSYQLDLLRKIMNGAELREIDWADKLEGKDRINFLKFCASVAGDPWFNTIITGLYWPNVVKAGTVAENIVEVYNNRAAVNGISMVKEYFDKYASIYKAEFETPAPETDEHKAFDPIDAEEFFKGSPRT